ncbi:MAG: hypothetical protein OEL66_06000 [Desulfobulbaceae bacterium]|nr:hypothetical protein [Desulfobulbaceae bacterium]
MSIQQVNLVQLSALCQQKNFPILFLTHQGHFTLSAKAKTSLVGNRLPLPFTGPLPRSIDSFFPFLMPYSQPQLKLMLD